MPGVDERGQVVGPGLVEQPVGDHHAQPGPDPVGDDQQEALVGLDVVEREDRHHQTGRAHRQGDRGAREGRRQPQPERGERHRRRVEVQRVRRDRADEDREQGDRAEPGRQQGDVGAGGVGAVPVRGAHGRDGRRSGDLQQDAAQEVAEPGVEAGAPPVVRRQVSGVVRRVRVPARGVAEGGAQRDPEAAGDGVAHRPGLRRGQDQRHPGDEDHRPAPGRRHARTGARSCGRGTRPPASGPRR